MASLDDTAALGAVPFMPEMLPFVGKRFTVSKRVEKICDLIGPGGSRRMRETVLLEDLRCDGSAHGGCQARCKFFWKEEWLRPVGAEGDARQEEDDAAALDALATLAEAGVAPIESAERKAVPGGLRCQATEAFVATEPLRTSEPGQYVREITSRNVSIPRFARVAVRALWGSLGHRLGFKDPLPIKLGGDKRVSPDALNLQPGEWVQVKSAEEIGLTLDNNGTNKGLTFTVEMMAACGHTFQVKERVNRIVDERTGKMLVFKNECIMLEDAICTGDRVPGRWFCPKDSYPFWREAWLRRVDPPARAAGTTEFADASASTA
jgi:hypothetical protein